MSATDSIQLVLDQSKAFLKEEEDTADIAMGIKPKLQLCQQCEAIAYGILCDVCIKKTLEAEKRSKQLISQLQEQVRTIELQLETERMERKMQGVPAPNPFPPLESSYSWKTRMEDNMQKYPEDWVKQIKNSKWNAAGLASTST